MCKFALTDIEFLAMLIQHISALNHRPGLPLVVAWTERSGDDSGRACWDFQVDCSSLSPRARLKVDAETSGCSLGEGKTRILNRLVGEDNQ